MNKQAYYKIMKMASLLKAAENKKKPYSALDVDTSKDGYSWPTEKDPQLGNKPYSKGGYLRELNDRKTFKDWDNPIYANSDYNYRIKNYPKGSALNLRRDILASDGARSIDPTGSKLQHVLLKAFRQSGDIKHKNYLKTNKPGTVSPDQITIPGFKDIFNLIAPEKKKKIQYYLNTVAQNKNKSNVVV